MINKEGYLYTASGQKYVDEAKKALRSLKEVHPDAIAALLIDSDTPIPELHNFDIIKQIEVPQSGNKKIASHSIKLLGMLHTPFEKTFFLDTDTYMCENCQELFEVLDWFDLLICHDYHETRWPLLDNKELIGCNPYNSGVVVYKKNTVTESFIQDWYDRFISNYDIYQGDQPAFMEALLHHLIKVYSLQTIYNFRFNQFLTISYGKVKILHGRHLNLEQIASRLNESEKHRCWNPRKWRCQSWYDSSTYKERLYNLKKNLF